MRTRDPSGAGGAGRQQQPAHGGVGSTRGWSEGGRDQRGREQEEEEMKNEAFLGFLPHFSPWFPALGFWESPQDP